MSRVEEDLEEVVGLGKSKTNIVEQENGLSQTVCMPYARKTKQVWEGVQSELRLLAKAR